MAATIICRLIILASPVCVCSSVESQIDKICSPPSAHKYADASAEGVQRDLLPLIEGTTITTKQGDVKTDHILFIASGAFHAVKPSDLMAELQVRRRPHTALSASCAPTESLSPCSLPCCTLTFRHFAPAARCASCDDCV